jgi:hypothetical protein
VGLLLCGHHYRVSRAALHAIGADVYDQAGALITAGEGERSPRQPQARRGNKPIAAAT